MPERLEDWDIEILDKLVQLRDIEGETFDFKGTKLSGLEEHICAMANTSGGQIVLGVDEITDSSGNLLGFKKMGFSQGKEDDIGLDIGNAMFKIDPVPKLGIRHIADEAEKKFYTVLKVEIYDIDRPYFFKQMQPAEERLRQRLANIIKSLIE